MNSSNSFKKATLLLIAGANHLPKGEDRRKRIVGALGFLYDLPEKEANGTIDYAEDYLKQNATPDGVDLTAEDQPQIVLADIPTASMYGKAADYARELGTPLGYGYPTILAVSAGCGIEPSGHVRPALNVVNVGPKGWGKSQSRERAQLKLKRKITPAPISDNDGYAYIIDATPGSDHGLGMLCKDKSGPVLLSLDEFRNMTNKAGIEFSSLSSVLCELHNKDSFTTASRRGGLVRINVRLSIVGGLAAKNPSEFSEVFNFATAAGLADRFLYGFTTEEWNYTPPNVRPIEFAPSQPEIPSEMNDRVNAWRKGKPERKRMGELLERVAYISSAINGDTTITKEAIDAAVAFMEWQERFRTVYRGGTSSDLWTACVDEIEEAFKASQGKCFNFRTVATNRNWYRKYAKCLNAVRSLLEKDGVIQYDSATKKHFWRGGE